MIEGRARGRAGLWPETGATLPWAPLLPEFARPLAERLDRWAAADVAPGRLLPWIPVAFAAGIAVYFSAETEPVWWMSLSLALIAALAAALARRRPLAFPLLVGLAAIAAGFATATLRAAAMSHPVLRSPAYDVAIAGFVETREERERTDRMVIRVTDLQAARLSDRPNRVRVTMKKGTAPPVGSHVSLKARLNPPLQPLRPGGYDFARDLYFHGVGASGYVVGAIKLEAAREPPGLKLRLAAGIEGIRDTIDRRIRAVLAGDAGAIASALITGKRDAISAPVNDAMYVSSLAHVLSISGYHMAIVAGVVFFVIRALLALSATLATGYPIKKWAAGAALAAAALYLVLSGAEVATQRSFIMTAVVLIGVMADRPALTLRTLAVAALAVLLMSPEAVVHPSFQMSFAATLALIALYERGLPWVSAGARTSFGARVALWGGREMAALILASLIAGLATTPYAAFHFHRLAPYGVIANLLAMPIVSGWVMPAGLIGLLAMPFGLDAPLWRLMGLGIDWMTFVAVWVAGLAGAVGRIAAFGVGPLILGSAGLVVLCLLRSPLRLAGAAVIAMAAVAAVRTPQPDVLIAAGGEAVAVRGADGRLQMWKGAGAPFAVREWLAADGDARSANDALKAGAVACDDEGCVARLADGKPVAIATTADALADDCGRAVLVVTMRQMPPDCAATVIDRAALRSGGATALRRTADGWEIVTARRPGEARPWAPAAIGTAASPSRAPTASRPAPRDATPRTDDLDAEDGGASPPNNR